MALGWEQLVAVQGLNVLRACPAMSQAPLGPHRFSLAGCWLWSRCHLWERPPQCHGKTDSHSCVRMWRDFLDHLLRALQNLKCLQASADCVSQSSWLGIRKCKWDPIQRGHDCSYHRAYWLVPYGDVGSGHPWDTGNPDGFPCRISWF